MKVLHIVDHLGLGGAQTIVRGVFEKQKNNKNIFLFSLRKRNYDKIDHFSGIKKMVLNYCNLAD